VAQEIDWFWKLGQEIKQRNERRVVNCAQFQEVVDELVRGQLPVSGVGRVASAHADACADCDKLLANAQQLHSSLLALASADRDAQMPTDSKADVMTAFYKHHAPKRSMPSVQTRWFAAIGLAAALLMGIVLYHFGAFNAVRNPWARKSTPAVQAPSTQDASVTSTDDSSSADAENVTAFVDLPFADPWASDDDEAVLRVNVPQSTLAAYGLPVAEPNRDDQVTAEFIVGEDGVPRAVRLVK